MMNQAYFWIQRRSLKELSIALSISLASFLANTSSFAQQPAKQVQTIAAISERGQKLLIALDNSDVESLWQPGVHVDWETGIADGKPLKGNGKHTHCSAFAAAMAKRLGVYLLRPPEHSPVLLANAQFDWLSAHARDLSSDIELASTSLQNANDEWFRISDAYQAQSLANGGHFVVAVYRNHYDDRPGHIAIVRPAQKSATEIDEEGPQITQAGGHNYFSTTVKQGFASHPAAWKKQELRYFVHALKW